MVMQMKRAPSLFNGLNFYYMYVYRYILGHILCKNIKCFNVNPNIHSMSTFQVQFFKDNTTYT